MLKNNCKQYKLYTMDEEKCCNDDCCKPDTPDSEMISDRPSGSGLLYASDYRSAEPEPMRDDGNRIHDLVIKQMDLGYLVKVGCQTLCLETKERLIDLFTAYLNNPELTMEKYYIDKFQTKPKKHVIGIVGYSQEDIDHHVKYNLIPLKALKKTANRYVGVIDGESFEVYGITKEVHVTGLSFDHVLETFRARENKAFSEIIERCNAALKR